MHKIFVNDRVITGTWDAVYSRYLKEILDFGDTFVGRNGETKALFGSSVTVDLRHSFPLTQLRKMPIQNLFREMLFDIGFSQNVEALGPAKHFWDFLADEDGELGASAYNRQWRMWPPSAEGAEVKNERLANEPVDQLQKVIDTLRRSNTSRHGTVITSNPTAIDPGCPPCHLAMQFMPRPNGTLDMMVPARSNDMVVGFPLDIARYAIITHVVAAAVGMIPGRVYMPSANSHIYENCYGLAQEIMSREAKYACRFLLSPEWDSSAEKPLETLRREYMGVSDYDPHPAIKVNVN